MNDEIEMKIKKCSKCNIEKNLNEFYKDKSKSDGNDSRCKQCRKEYEQSNKGKLVRKKYNSSINGLKSRSRYIKSEKGMIVNRKASKKYYKKNKDKVLKYRSNYLLKYRHTEHGKKVCRKIQNKYKKTENGKILVRRQNAKRRYKKYIELYPNPFDESEEVEWHHIDDIHVVAILKDLHRLYCGQKYHKILCKQIIKQIYE